MEITLEKIELVKDRTGSTYAEAKAALEAADGSVVDAIIALEEEINREHDKVDGASLKDSPLFAKLKEIVDKGNVSRIVVRRKDKEILNIPVNVGVVGAAVGLAAAKWVLLASVLATVGFGCVVEIIKADGDVVNVVDEESSKKVRDFAADTVEKVKEAIPVSINVEVKHDNFDKVVDADAEEIQSAPADDSPSE